MRGTNYVEDGFVRFSIMKYGLFIIEKEKLNNGSVFFSSKLCVHPSNTSRVKLLLQ